ARRRAYALDGLAALADDDFLLAFAGDVNSLLHPRGAVGLVLPQFGFDGGLIGQFVVQPFEQFFAGDFSGERAQGRVRNLVLGIEPGAYRHQAGELFLEFRYAMTLERRNHESLGKRQPRVDVGSETEQSFVLYGVDLVQHQNFRRPQLRQFGEDRLHFLVHALARVDQQRDRVGVAGAAPGGSHHGAVEPAFWRENARRVDEDDLVRPFQRNAAHQGARRLHLSRDDRNLGPDELIEQSRFPGVGRADQRDEAAMGPDVFLTHFRSPRRPRAPGIFVRRPVRPNVSKFPRRG